MQYEKGLVFFGLFFFLVGGIIVVQGMDNGDADDDGVADTVDLCLNSIIDKPTKDWGTNRYLWLDGGSHVFTVLTQTGEKVDAEYTMAQTGGCSCADILGVKGGSDSSGQYKLGCSNGVIQGWINKLNR